MVDIKYPEGSRWWKWDLHCHTPDDKNWIGKPASRKERKDFVKKYLKKAYDSGLKVLAITNHFNYNDISESYLPLLQEAAKNYNITILPGCEITAKEGSGIHLLIIFPEKMELNTIQNLMIKLFPTPRRAPENVIPLSDFNIVEINDILKKNIGDNFLLIFAHVDSSNGLLKSSTIQGANRASIWKYNFIQFAQWTQNPYNYSEDNFYTKIINNLDENYIREITHIVASDCRSINPVPNNNHITFLGQKFTWIKTNPSFEGLKQIFYDSEFRIQFQEINPINENKQYFTSINLGNNQLFLDGRVSFTKTEIPLNRDMITIIGSRGTGKSLLLNVFAKLHNKPTKFCENLKKIILNSDFKIPFCKEKDLLIESKIDNRNELDYIHVNQSEVREICENPIDMNEAIRQLIGIPSFSHPSDWDEKITLLIDSFFDLCSWFEEQDENGNNIHTEAYNNQKIEEYNKKIKYIKTTKSQEQIEKLRENERKYFQFSKAISELELLKIEIDKTSTKLNQKINSINLLAKEIEPIPLIDLNNQLQKLDEMIPYFKNEIERINKENENISVHFQELGIDDIDFKIDQVKNYENFISLHKNYLTQIQEKIKFLNKIFPDLAGIVKIFQKKIDDYQTIIEEKWRALKNKELSNEEQTQILSKLLETMEIKPKNYFNIDEFYSIISEYLNKTKFRQRSNETQLQRIIYTINVKSYEDYLKLIKNEPVIELDGEKITLREFIDKKEYFNLNSDREFLKCLFKSKYIQRYFEVISTTRFLDREIDTLSMGERGTLFLRLKLATAAFSLPFIFDQPEDDLDNSFIQNELVPLFRKIKKYRQLIIATHDANIVVNSNAEQIIIATNESEQISYITGGLEEPYIRERICDILEGGENAFQKRARKYGLL